MHTFEARGLSKSFFGYPALADVDLEIAAGEVHGLVGENGAGKSTLMKILAGAQQADSGSMWIDGEQISFAAPIDAYAAGISTVYQELNLLPERTVAENIFLGREPRRFGLVRVATMEHNASELLSDIGVTGISPTALVGSLSVAQQQVVEIVKALSYRPRIISMDEPTAALAEHEVELLFDIVRRLTSQGVAVLYVSHRMREIFALCDRITVLKDGRLVQTLRASETDESELVRLMVGRPLSTFFPEKETEGFGDELLSISAGGNDWVNNISLSLRSGEILGIAGLQGSGRTELLEAIAGVAPFTRGDLWLNEERWHAKTPAQSIDAGIAFVTEDRKHTGLALEHSIEDNIKAVVRSRKPDGWRDVNKRIAPILESLDVSARGPDQIIRFLSGGNQQKVVLAKWLLMDPAIILMDEPTRGVDVGAKRTIYELMRRLAAEGHGIIMVSSELPEVIGMSDRILVMRDGVIAGKLAGDGTLGAVTEESIAAVATGTVKLP